MRPIPRISPDAIRGAGFDEIVDVRSPAEYAEDHLPGAINLPVLDDAERERVGTTYKQRSPFEARRLGAGLVSANIARHLAGHLAEKEAGYSPLIYCWRGGERSRSMATVIDSIGWRPRLLDGGYKAYRAFVASSLAAIVDRRPRFRVIAGLTGSGKTWLLGRLAAAGQQVLDLEGLAAHRGSALGACPGGGQPSQKRFENLLFEALRDTDPERPIYVESESSRIGERQIPAPLWGHLRSSPVIEIEAPLRARAAYLVSDYEHLVSDRDLLAEKLEKVRPLQPGERFAEWQRRIADGDWQSFVESMLKHHYDPAYLRSREKIYSTPQVSLPFAEVSEAALDALASRIVDLEPLAPRTGD